MERRAARRVDRRNTTVVVAPGGRRAPGVVGPDVVVVAPGRRAPGVVVTQPAPNGRRATIHQACAERFVGDQLLECRRILRQRGVRRPLARVRACTDFFQPPRLVYRCLASPATPAAIRDCGTYNPSRGARLQCIEGGAQGQVVVAHAPPAAQPVHTVDTALIEACDRAFTSQRDEQQCLQTGAAPLTVDTCDDAFTGGRDTLACITRAARPALIEACDRAFVGNRDTLDCIDRNGSVAEIEACDRAFISTRDTLTCIDEHAHPVTIQACDQAFVSTRDTIACIHRRAAPETVEACDRAFVGSRDILACIDNHATY